MPLVPNHLTIMPCLESIIRTSLPVVPTATYLPFDYMAIDHPILAASIFTVVSTVPSLSKTQTREFLKEATIYSSSLLTANASTSSPGNFIVFVIWSLA